LPIANLNSVVGLCKLEIGNRQLPMLLLRFFVTSVFAATAAELAEFQPIRRGFLILGRHVIPTFAILTLKHNVIAWHTLFPISDCQLPIVQTGCLQSAIGNWQSAMLLFNNL
jgi:hypothetical protein